MVNLKSTREIALMRRAGLAVWEAHQIAARMVRPGATTAAIDRAIGEHFENLGAQPLFKNYPNPTRNKPPFPAVCCMSVNEAVVHGIPNDRPLKEGDILSLDTGCRLNGWCGDAAYTYSVGQISPQVQRLLDATQGVLKLAIELMNSKSYWSAISREMANYIRDHGYSTVECFVGHGIGRDMHEPPNVPNHGRPGRGLRLTSGMVLAIEPMLNAGGAAVRVLDDGWTVVTEDASLSAHAEHTVAITDAGPQVLTAA